jgi:hypothetical protein
METHCRGQHFPVQEAIAAGRMPAPPAHRREYEAEYGCALQQRRAYPYATACIQGDRLGLCLQLAVTGFQVSTFQSAVLSYGAQVQPSREDHQG